jgi:hypothetical protein
LLETVFIAEINGFTFRAFFHVRVIAGVKTLPDKVSAYCSSIEAEKFPQDPPVSPQGTVHIPHIIIHFTIEPVIVRITAKLRTEFFICPAVNTALAFRTFFVHEFFCDK